MPGTRHAHNLDSLLAKVDDLALVKGRTLKEIGRALKRVIPIAGKNLEGRETPDGIVLSGHAEGGEATPCPFECVASGSGSVTFTALGAINGVIPSNLFGAGGFLSLTVPASGLGYIVIACTASSGGISAASITTRVSAPAPASPALGAPPASFDVLIFVTLDGVPYRAVACGNLFARATIVAAVDKVTPVCGGLPSDYYYQWTVEAV